MTGCPMAYADPCSSCAQFGNCSPSQAVKKLENLELKLKELMQLVEQLSRQK